MTLSPPLLQGTIVLGGGGNSVQAGSVYEYFVSVLAGDRLLFLPHALSPRLSPFADTYRWITSAPPFQDCRIEMWEAMAGRTHADLEGFDGICLGGGNTYDLLGALQETAFSERIIEFALEGGSILGISAGAIVLGRDITTEGLGADPDTNTLGVTDLRGLDLLNGYNAHCHYEPSEDANLTDSRDRHGVATFAIPETAGVAITGASARAIGTGQVTLFRERMRQSYESGQEIT
jgi:dipeptidase E